MRKTFKTIITCITFTIITISNINFSFGQDTSSGIITANSVNFRKTPSTKATILGCFQKNTPVTIIEASDDWCKITYNDTTGWVYASYVKKTDSSIPGFINASNVNLRSAASTSSNILGVLKNGTSLSIISASDSWYKVKTEDGTIGYVYSQYVSKTGSSSTSRSGSTINNSRTTDNVVSYAKKFLGVKYVYGGSTPNGFDCSGFVKYVYHHFGYNLARVAAEQATQGTWVKKANLAPGDLVFFDTDGGRSYINHAGIYIDDGQFIHASSGSSSRKVVISDLTSGFYAKTYMTARRIIK